MGIAYNRHRFVILAIGLMCLTSICSNYIIINFTFICMKEDMSDTVDIGNGTLKSIYDYTQQEKSSIIWAVAIGTIIGTFPINYLYIKYGARYPFMVAGIMSTISTLLIPQAARLGIPVLLAVRFLQGLAYSADFAAIGLVCVRWAPLSELAIYIGILTSFTPISAIVTNAATGLLCGSPLGWRSSYYLHGAFGALAFFLWFMYYSDKPEICKSVSKKELRQIQKDKSAEHIEHKSDVPYKRITGPWFISLVDYGIACGIIIPYIVFAVCDVQRIFCLRKLLTSPAILSVWFNAFCEMSAMILLSTYSPTYFRHVFGFKVETTGFLVSLTTIAQLPVKLICGLASDRIKFLSEKVKMNIFNTLAVGVVGAMFCFVGYVPLDFKWYAVVIFSLIHTLSSCNCGGFYKCGTFVARQHAHVVIATIQFMKCIALFTAPALVNFFVEDDANKGQWATVFLVCGIIMIIANLLSFPVFTDQAAEWTNSKAGINEEKVEMKEKE